ncbi:hypothetical protein E2C01_007845 [Portunus trituberculatus]|uniref:Uncharacterized protein n=1 Tax=Portunus trituberculatus TaxID=210409 RepID=A0A5B7D4W3_PORTR|nr:hypothetical protein [Portunus trituberculatus]
MLAVQTLRQVKLKTEQNIVWYSLRGRGVMGGGEGGGDSGERCWKGGEPHSILLHFTTTTKKR